MPTFEWKAIDAGGRYQKGVMEGDSSRQIRAKLRAKNLSPVQVEATDSAPGGRAGA